MNLTCEVVLSSLSFRIRSLNLMRAVGFGKSTEGPAKEAGFSEVDPGPLNPRGMLPLLYWALDEKLWGCLTGHISYHMV